MIGGAKRAAADRPRARRSNSRRAVAVTWTGVLAFLYLAIFGSLVAFSAFGWLVTVARRRACRRPHS